MVTSDLLVLIFLVLINYILAPRLPQAFYMNSFISGLNSLMSIAVTDCSVWLTVSFTFDRFVAICCQSFKRRFCAPKSSALVVGAIYLVTYLRNIPNFFTNVHYYDHEEMERESRDALSTDLIHAWRVFDWVKLILNPLVPYVAVMLLNLLTVRHVLAASRVRRGFRVDGQSTEDPELQNRRKALILLIAASGSFILLWMPTIGLFLFSRITATYRFHDFKDPVAVIHEIADMLSTLNCSTSTCVYALTQSKLRAELRGLVRYGKDRITETPATRVNSTNGANTTFH
ncbi:probable G-protein coupled receptor 139 [Scyliorhinus canicula]|uniref:probable G-protein coupled receptor 139 n=1 Tax=Scyliorhinus canicula TaxID=7830 RepID=UPI0018F641F9|nr:probable G-protein coupled receptor 139 [Scyliorhinus canicula]